MPVTKEREELIPGAFHNTEQYANNRIEADHGRLKARLRPMRGLKRRRHRPRDHPRSRAHAEHPPRPLRTRRRISTSPAGRGRVHRTRPNHLNRNGPQPGPRDTIHINATAPFSAPAGYWAPPRPIGERSVEMLKSFGGASFNVRVPVHRGGGPRVGEQFPRPFEVTGRVALGKHGSPPEVGASVGRQRRRRAKRLSSF